MPKTNSHEKVIEIEDPKSGLSGFIAIHNKNLGPAIGGTRYQLYESRDLALEDALRLSRAMSYKCALADAPHGGGKGVIMANPKKQKKKQLKEYARQINLLKGNFFTGEDVGLVSEDIKILSKRSPYIVGLADGGKGPGVWAAVGVFWSIIAALEEIFGTPRIEGRKFAIRGLGKVGQALCVLLANQGGKIVGADIDQDAVESVKARCPQLEIVHTDEIQSIPVDVYSPCALGDEFDAYTALKLQCKIICGGANNQLATPEIDRVLFERGVLYVPDYVANAGGLIRVVDELYPGGYNESRVRKKVVNIRNTIRHIIEDSKSKNKSTASVADGLAEEIFLK